MLVPPPDILQTLVVTPRSKRPFELIFDHVDEPSGSNPVLHQWLDEHLLAEQLAAFDGQFTLGLPQRAWWDRAVVRLGERGELGVLKIAAWCEMS